MRMHLFEFGDQVWFPGPLRDGMTAYLAATYRMLPVPVPWAVLLQKALQRSGSRRVIDLCSGAGGPLPLVLDRLAAIDPAGVDVVRTDLYPSDGVRRVDARRVPPDLQGVRTLFAAFHHFRPEEAVAILRDAAGHGQSICVFEATRRHPLAVALTLLVPLMTWLVTPRIRPLRWTQIVFTYLVPILPLTIAWDGLVSHLRTYSVSEMRAMVAKIALPDYEWEAGELRVPGVPFPLPYLAGYPRRETCA